MVYPDKEAITVAAPNYITREDLRDETRYINNRVDDLRKKIKLLVRILVDKKIIGSELAKTFEETVPSDILKWYLKDIKEGE